MQCGTQPLSSPQRMPQQAGSPWQLSGSSPQADQSPCQTLLPIAPEAAEQKTLANLHEVAEYHRRNHVAERNRADALQRRLQELAQQAIPPQPPPPPPRAHLQHISTFDAAHIQ